MLTDTIADMLSRIRNACMAKHKFVLVPAARFSSYVLDVLKLEGYIWDYSREKSNNHDIFNIKIKYYNGVSVISQIKRVSKPGCKVYTKCPSFISNDPGVLILSTPQGVMSSIEAYKKKIGGEVVCYVR